MPELGGIPDAVFLDVGGVLLAPHPEPIMAALARAGIQVHLADEDVLRAHYVGVAAIDEGPDPRSAYIPAFIQRLGLPDGSDEALEPVWRLPALDIWRLLVPGSVDGLRQLASTGRKLAVISNSDGSVEAQLLHNRICQVGEGAGVPVLAIVDSAVVGLAKPDPRIFHYTAEQLGVPVERTLYVGDSRRYDVAGALAAGLQPIHFDPFELCPEREAHPHVHTLAEVTYLI